MRFTFLLMLVVAFAGVNESEGWRFWRRVKKFLSHLRVNASYDRDHGFHGKVTYQKKAISEIDSNHDGVIDQTELEKIMSKRDAEDFLDFVNENGESDISVEDFERIARELA